MKQIIELLTKEFQKNANPEYAVPMKRYMKNIGNFFGIKSGPRREISKCVLKKTGLPDKDQYSTIVRQLWNKDEREFQYFAQELAEKFVREAEWQEMKLYEYMISTKSWWDTVDFIAAKLVGPLMKKYPDHQRIKVDEWIKSENLWLQRTAILFQLKYKEETDASLLFEVINRLKNIHTFFIEKAIGWALREYAKSQPQKALDFVNATPLPPLSRREALKRITGK